MHRTITIPQYNNQASFYILSHSVHSTTIQGKSGCIPIPISILQELEIQDNSQSTILMQSCRNHKILVQLKNTRAGVYRTRSGRPGALRSPIAPGFQDRVVIPTQPRLEQSTRSKTFLPHCKNLSKSHGISHNPNNPSTNLNPIAIPVQSRNPVAIEEQTGRSI